MRAPTRLWLPLDRHLPTITSFGVLIALLIIYQLQIAALPRSIWLDEAWLLNSARAERLHDALYYSNWAQTTPPLFLLILRGLQRHADLSPEYLPAVPACFALATLPLFWYLARRILAREYAAIALLLYAGSPIVWTYAQVIKQYSADLFAALLCAALGLRVLRTPRTAGIALWAGTAFVCYTLAFNVIFFIPGVLLVLAWQARRAGAWSARERASPAAVWLAGSVLTLACGTVYAVLIHPNTGIEALRTFWEFGFIDFANGRSHWFVYLAAYHLLSPFPLLPHRPLPVAALGFVVALGVATLAVREPKSPDPRHFAWACCIVPLAMLALFNLLRIYPLHQARLTLFLYPFIVIAACAGLAAAVSRIRLRPGTDSRRASALLVTLLVTIWIGSRIERVRATWLEFNGRENVAGALAVVTALRQPGDRVYIHASLREQYAFYGPRYAMSAEAVVLGEIDWPCCSPLRPWQRDRARPDPAAVRAELARIAAQSGGRRLWVLISIPHVHAARRQYLLEEISTVAGPVDWATLERGVAIRRFSCDRAAACTPPNSSLRQELSP